ncbi:MAG: hypothetical protein ABI591_32045 [Kofleriaceae bacterium]
MRLTLGFFLISAATACGGGDTTTVDAQDVGFTKPKATLKANMQVSTGVWTEIGDADLTSCAADAGTAQVVTLNTKVVDFQNQTAVPAATVIAFPGIDTANPFDTKTSDANGLISFTIPPGTKRFGFKMSADSQFPTFLLNQYVLATDVDGAGMTTEPATVQSVSNATAALLPALIGQTRTPGTGVVAGAVRDCGRHEISNYVATVSSTSGTATPIAGAQAFYFSLAPELPVHHTQAEAAAANALFMGIQLPATSMAYVQAWGFPTAADLASGEMKLVSELAVPVLADTVVTASFEPLHN